MGIEMVRKTTAWKFQATNSQDLDMVPKGKPQERNRPSINSSKK